MQKGEQHNTRAASFLYLPFHFLKERNGRMHGTQHGVTAIANSGSAAETHLQVLVKNCIPLFTCPFSVGHHQLSSRTQTSKTVKRGNGPAECTDVDLHGTPHYCQHAMLCP